MNERIIELADKAGISLSSFQFSGIPTKYEVAESDLEKFAELIVKECMACSTWVGKVNNNAIEPVHTAHAINQRIRKQFGVEE